MTGPRRARRTRRARVPAAVAIGGVAAASVLAALGGRSRRGDRVTSAAASSAPSVVTSDAEEDVDRFVGLDEDASLALVERGERHTVATFGYSLADYELSIEQAWDTTLAAILEHTGAELAVNGAFFDRDGNALGLAMSGGVVLSRLARSASGGVLTWDGTRGRLFETESFAPPDGVRFAIQCRPRLVVGGRANVTKDDGKRAERTALCLRDEGRWLDVVIVHASPRDPGDSPGPSLYALSRFLVARGCEDALNLDGGPSTGYAWRTPGGSTESRPPRGPVRHAIVIALRR